MDRLRWVVLCALGAWAVVLMWALLARLWLPTCSGLRQTVPLGIALALAATALFQWLGAGSNARKNPWCLIPLVAPASVVLAFLGVVPMETIFVFDPLIDTHSPAGFSAEAFSRIRQGQTSEQVLQSLGEPLYRVDLRRPAKGRAVEWVYSVDGACSWCDAAYLHRSVSLVDGRVIETRQQWFCN